MRTKLAWRSPHRRAGMLVLAAAGTLVLACATTARVNGRRSHVGELPMKVESLAANAEGIRTFQDIVDTAAWSGAPPRARCADTECTAPGGRRTLVKVDAIEDADGVDLARLPREGVVIARFMNLGQYEEAKYGLRPGANTFYYIVVEPPTGPPSSGRRVALQKLVTLTDGPGAATLTVRTLGNTFFECPHPHLGPPKRYKADFANCDPTAAPPGPASSTERAAPMAAVNSEIDFAWIACTRGCCTSEIQ